MFYGTGNPNPAYYGQDRQGDNLYTSSIVALDADSGKLRWHYQFTPHDLHDWDAAQVPVLATLKLKQGMTKVVMQANRNGLFYVIDRATGKVLFARPFVQNAWATGVSADGRPVVPNDLAGLMPASRTTAARRIFRRRPSTPPVNCFSSRHVRHAPSTRLVRRLSRLRTKSR